MVTRIEMDNPRLMAGIPPGGDNLRDAYRGSSLRYDPRLLSTNPAGWRRGLDGRDLGRGPDGLQGIIRRGSRGVAAGLV